MEYAMTPDNEWANEMLEKILQRIADGKDIPAWYVREYVHLIAPSLKPEIKRNRKSRVARRRSNRPWGEQYERS